MPRSKLSSAASLFLGLVLFTSALTGTSAQELKKITLIFPPISDVLPAYVAKDQKIFEKNGLDVTLTAVANLSVVTSSLVAKSADIGFSVAISAIQAKDAGIDQVIVAGGTVLPVPPGNAGLLARAGSNIHQASDLVGKRVAVAGLRAFHHLVLVEWLRSQGVDDSKVNFVEVPFPQQADVLRSGQIDAVVTIDPIYGRIVNSGIGYSFADYLKVVPDGTNGDFYITMRAWAKEHPDILKAFHQSLDEGIAFIKANDKEARVSLQRWTKQPEAIANAAILPVFSTRADPSQMMFFFELAKHQNLLKTDVKVEDLYLN